MKKNKMMRIASVLLIAVLMTTCAISGTFAKYTTSAEGSDVARVANWGFESDGELTIDDLFIAAYDNVSGVNADVIAPGTTNSVEFEFVYDETNVAAPEVAYTFTIDVSESTCADTIQNNVAIQWRLDEGTWGTWEDLLNSIKLLSGEADGSAEYAAGQLPDDFADAHTIEWQWIFEVETNDANDTAMGNADELAEVELVISITVEQDD